MYSCMFVKLVNAKKIKKLCAYWGICVQRAVADKKTGRILKLAVIETTMNKNLKQKYEGEHRKQTKTVHIMIL